MALPIRFRVRTLIVIVAVVALGMGAVIGWVKHSEYDSDLELQTRISRQIAWHLRQANACRAAEARGLPYPKKDRAQLFANQVTIFRTLNYSLPDWPTEARLHDDWASALQDGPGVLYAKDPN